jgi:hypothetical protein
VCARKKKNQVSLQRKIEESDFENAQDMFAQGNIYVYISASVAAPPILSRDQLPP